MYVWWQVSLHITLFHLAKTLLVARERSPTLTDWNRKINLLKSGNSLAFSLAELRVLDKVTRTLSISGLYIPLCWLHANRLFPQGREMAISNPRENRLTPAHSSKKGAKMYLTGLSLVTGHPCRDSWDGEDGTCWLNNLGPCSHLWTQSHLTHGDQ